MPAAAAADRAEYAARSDKAGSRDLVGAVSSGGVKLDDVSTDKLPAEMKKMSEEERKRYISDRQQERERIQKQIRELSDQRSRYIAKELAKKGDAPSGFDGIVLESLRVQAKTKGIAY